MILAIIVKANSKIDQIIVEKDNSVKVKIKASPIEGKANKYLLNYLSKIFGISKSSIEIVSGFNNPYKKIKINAEEDKILSILSIYK